MHEKWFVRCLKRDVNKGVQKKKRGTMLQNQILISGCQHDNVFSCAVPELNHILVSQFQVPTIRNFAIIQYGSIGAFQIDQVRLHSANFVSILVSFFRVTKLYHGMLLANAGVLGWQVHNCHLPSNQPAASQAEINSIDNVASFEDKELPLVSGRRLPSFRWFMVLEDNG